MIIVIPDRPLTRGLDILPRLQDPGPCAEQTTLFNEVLFSQGLHEVVHQILDFRDCLPVCLLPSRRESKLDVWNQGTFALAFQQPSWKHPGIQDGKTILSPLIQFNMIAACET